MRILNLEPLDFNPQAAEAAASCGDYRALPDGLTEHDVAFWQEVAKAEVLWTRLAFRLDAKFLKKAPKLRVIVTPTTGLNHVDLGEVARRDIHLVCLKGEDEFLSSITSTAELTLSLMLEAMRHTGRAHQAVVDRGEWDRDAFRGRQLAGQRLGIVGMGRLGRIVAEYALALRMPVMFCDTKTDDELRVPQDIRRVGLERLLRESDVVTLHVSYSPQNRNMIGFRELEMMQRHAWLINTSRGELVDEAALLAALQGGVIGGAALDVLADENSVGSLGLEHPLLAYAGGSRNLIVTPHIGGACRDAMHATELFVARKLVRLLKGSAENL